MNPWFFNRSRNKNSCGMTLVEVILSAAIIGILAVAVTTALFYPRYLVVTSGLEQLAIHAGTAEIERQLHDYTAPAAQGQFSLTAWNIVVTNIPPEIITEAAYDNCRYLRIQTKVTYRDGSTVDLVTYRSLELPSSER